MSRRVGVTSGTKREQKGKIGDPRKRCQDTGLALGPSPFLSHLGGTNVSQGLALLYIMSNNMYLGFDTSLVSSSMSPVTLTSGGGGKKTLVACATGKQLLRE